MGSRRPGGYRGRLPFILANVLNAMLVVRIASYNAIEIVALPYGTFFPKNTANLFGREALPTV